MSLAEDTSERDRDCLGWIALDPQTTIIRVSDGITTESGIVAADLLGRSAIEMVHPDDVERARQVLDEVRAIVGHRPEGVYRLRHVDGSYRRYTVQATNLGEEQANTVVLRFTEPTSEVLAQAFADDAVDAMRMLSEDVSLDESFEWVAQVAERHVDGLQIVITTFDAGRPNRVFSRSVVPEPILRVNTDASPDKLPVHVEVALDDYKQGPWRSSRKIASLDFILPGRLTSILAGRNGEVVGYVEALRDTIEVPGDGEWLVHGMISRMMTAALHRYEFDRQLRRAADLDPLTGVLNRRKLFEVLGTDENLAGSLLYLIDLDRFSWVNNNLGHQAGDETLIAVSRALLRVCPEDALVARLGGDEFVVWIPTDSVTMDLEELGARISKVMVVPVGTGDRRVSVRGSIGMVQIRENEPVADALSRADMAMYSSKRSGGDSATLG